LQILILFSFCVQSWQKSFLKQKSVPANLHFCHLCPATGAATQIIRDLQIYISKQLKVAHNLRKDICSIKWRTGVSGQIKQTTQFTLYLEMRCNNCLIATCHLCQEWRSVMRATAISQWGILRPKTQQSRKNYNLSKIVQFYLMLLAYFFLIQNCMSPAYERSLHIYFIFNYILNNSSDLYANKPIKERALFS
jgi:hypothetical protein